MGFNFLQLTALRVVVYFFLALSGRCECGPPISGVNGLERLRVADLKNLHAFRSVEDLALPVMERLCDKDIGVVS